MFKNMNVYTLRKVLGFVRWLSWHCSTQTKGFDLTKETQIRDERVK